MSTTELVKLSAAEMAAKIKAKEVSSRELVEAHLAVIESAEPSVKAFLKVSADQALEQANAFDAKSDEDKAQMPELAGVPIAIKDMIVTKGIETTAASKILEGWVPPYDATVIEKLKAAGMPLLGKTNLDEFAQGSSTEHSAYQTTHNPWDTERVPGGSGGGSAAAVAAFEAPLALGTDTGGSIRQPGSLTGTVGVKPTYGGVSRFGAIAMASSLDQIGPCSRTVLDSALLQEVIGGHDKRDSTSIPEGPRPMVAAAREGMKRDLKGLKVGLIKELGGEGFHAGLKRGVIAGLQHGERGDARGHGERIPGKRPGLIHVPGGSHTAHVLAFAAERPNGQAAADDLAEAGQIRRHAEELSSSSIAEPKAGDHFIEDQQRTVGIAQAAQAGQKAGSRGHHAHVGSHRFHDDRRHLAPVALQQLFHRIQVVVLGQQSVLGGAPGDTCAVRVAIGQRAGARLDQHAVAVAVVAAVEFYNLVPAREAAGGADGAHDRLGAAVDHAHHFNGAHHRADQLGHLHFPLGGGAKTQAVGHGALHRLLDHRVAVAQDHGAPRAHIIDVSDAIHIGDAGAFGPLDEPGRAAHSVESTHRAVDSAGHDPLGPFKQFF